MDILENIDYIYVFWIAIVIVDFILLKKIARIYIYDSKTNSVKTEESMMLQPFILIIMGVLMIISICASDYIEYLAQEVIFISECFFVGINFIWFLVILNGQIKNGIKYRKSGSIKLVIYSHFLKNLVLIYFLYNYYDLIIK